MFLHQPKASLFFCRSTRVAESFGPFFRAGLSKDKLVQMAESDVLQIQHEYKTQDSFILSAQIFHWTGYKLTLW